MRTGHLEEVASFQVALRAAWAIVILSDALIGQGIGNAVWIRIGAPLPGILLYRNPIVLYVLILRS